MLTGGYPQLRNLHVYLTNQCNQHCKHCWVDGGDKHRQHVTAMEINKQIDIAIPLGLQMVKITGGEPLLYERDTAAILLHAAKNRLQTRLETNALLAKRGFIEKLSQFSTIVNTSLDGATQNTHDVFRNSNGSYKRTISSIKLLVAQGVRVEVVSCIHKNNVNEILQIIEQCVNLGVSSLKFNFPSRYGRAKDPGFGFHLFEADEIMGIVHNLEASNYNASKMKLDFDVPRIFRTRPLPGPRCNVLNLISILPDLRYSLCGIGVTLRELTFGTIETTNIDTVWRTNKILANLRSSISQKALGVCEKCIEYNLCYCHCVAYCFSEYGNLNGPHPLCQELCERGLFPEEKLIKNGRSGNHSRLG
jgi:AdoMet-dependent heme synthase